MTNQPEFKKKKKISRFTWGRSMIFGAGNGVTTLGLRTSSAGFTRRRIKKKITKNAKTLTPSMTLRLTSKIRMELWALFLSLRSFGLGFVLRRGSSPSASVADLILLRVVLRPFPLIFRLGFICAQMHSMSIFVYIFSDRYKVAIESVRSNADTVYITGTESHGEESVIMSSRWKKNCS